MKKRMLDVLRYRDRHCWHCGETEDLVPHHRRNRGMGGSKLLDVYSNLMLVCAVYNGLMESDSKVAEKARGFGHKLRSWEGTEKAVFDVSNGVWYELLDDGQKIPVSDS